MRDQISNKLKEIEEMNIKLETRNKTINEQYETLSINEKEEYQKYENYIKKNKVHYEITQCNIKEINLCILI
jgi:hypothetical protein